MVNTGDITWLFLPAPSAIIALPCCSKARTTFPSSENTGYDKLLHFSFSAEKTLSFGSKIGSGLGYLKEAVKDEAWSWLPGVNDKGWDQLDIKANEKGVQYGSQLRSQYSKTIQEFMKQNPSSKEKLPEK